MSQVRAGIVGTAGYVGGELIRILHTHPQVRLTVLSRVRAEEEQDIVALHPHLRDVLDAACRHIGPFDSGRLTSECDVVFIAAPHAQAIEIAPPLLDAGVRIIDMGADFRLRDAQVYEQWYKVQHTHPELLTRAVYGLPEANRELLRSATLVANPGCYPTSALLSLLPLVKADVVDVSSLIIDSKSGVSGAGRSKLTLDYFFTEVVNDFKAYNVAQHRHTPEIEQELSLAAGKAITVSFTPHLLPISRGIFTTAYATLKPGEDIPRLRRCYEEAYRDEPFVRLLPEGELPQIKNVIGSNYCDIGFVVDARTQRIIILSALDNLVKGAAGQAIQNMNLMFGFPETTGLTHAPLFP